MAAYTGKFKLGDRVKVVGYSGEDYDAPEGLIGSTGKVIGFVDDPEWPVRVEFDEPLEDGTYTWDGFSESQLEPVAPPKFKVGDKVRVVAYGGVQSVNAKIIGAVGVVSAVRPAEENPIEVRFTPPVVSLEWCEEIFTEDQLELVTSPEAATRYETLGAEIGKLVADKERAYGKSFERAAKIMAVLYPDGIPVAAYKDALGIVRVLDKLSRIATDKDAFGESPWADICGYSLLGVASRARE